MNPETKKEGEFLLRRVSGDFPMPDWVIFLPILFALGVLLLIVLLRRENRFRGMQWALLLVGAFAVVHLFLAFTFKSIFSWWVVLVPVLLIAFFHVCLMYVRDARSIHPVWAGFLGLLRVAVYAILAAVFLLPGYQLYDTLQRNWKVLVLFDVSNSMRTVDEIPEVGQDASKLPSRQDKVLAVLFDKQGTSSKDMKPAVFEQILQKSPVSAYRFGQRLDPSFVMNIAENGKMPDWNGWLKPDKNNIVIPGNLSEDEASKQRTKIYDLIESLTGGTNIGGSALQMANLETNNLLQAVIVVSDGQSNLGSEDAVEEFRARLSSAQRSVPIITLGVGAFRQPVSIRIDDLQAPEDARPDDKFPIRVEVIGAGLEGEDFQVTLEGQRIEDKDGKAVAGQTKYVLGPLSAKFEGKGDFPRNQVDFEIDLQELTKISAADEKAELLEGVWQFVARVPRNAREAFTEAEHISDPPTKITVQKRKLRVLLFAGGPTRDYQFLRTMLYREAMEKRIELSVYLQTARTADNIDQDVDGERLLRHFPDKLGPDDPTDKYSSLNEHDVIIAIDPDWGQLTDKQFELLEKWVADHAGGIVFVAGPVHTYFMSRPAGRNLNPLLNLLPVTLQDSRLHQLGFGHDASRPYYLNFTPAAKLYDFTKLDDASEDPATTWNEFFWRGKKPEAGKDVIPERGFYNYYPVKKTRPGSLVVATFAGPPSSRIEDGAKEQPYIVAMKVGQGKTMYIGSPETWRLRHHKAEYHQRFWIKMARYVSGGTAMQKKYGRILMQRIATTGTIPIEAQLKGSDLQPLSRDRMPVVEVKRPKNFKDEEDAITPKAIDLRAKNVDGEWSGWFVGNFPVRTPGEYEFKISIPGTSQSLTHRLTVRKPDLELDNVRNNFGRLYQIASDAGPVFDKMKADKRRELQQLLQPPSLKELEEVAESVSTEKPRLFFTTSNAHLIPDCLDKLPAKKESIKGQLDDLWDGGVDSGLQPVSAYYLLLIVPTAVGLLIAAILLFLRQNVGALAVLGLVATFALGVVLVNLTARPDWADFPIDFSFVLAVVVGLLATEWLTRKLLKLA